MSVETMDKPATTYAAAVRGVLEAHRGFVMTAGEIRAELPGVPAKNVYSALSVMVRQSQRSGQVKVVKTNRGYALV